MKYAYGVLYLKRVHIILSHGRYLSPFIGLMNCLQETGIACEAMLAGEEYPIEQEALYITDDEGILKHLLEWKLPVAVYLHEQNRCRDLSAARYAFEMPESLDVVYLERVYRRYNDISWDILETERCYLRETMVEDVDAFYELYKDPEMTRYTEALYESKVSECAYVREYIEKIYKYFEFGVWTVVLKETGEVIGRAGLNVREGYDLPELGYVIGRTWQGQGIATEVCRGILRFAKEEYDFEQIMTLIQEENQVSLHLAQGLGFQIKEKILLENRGYLMLITDNLQM